MNFNQGCRGLLAVVIKRASEFFSLDTNEEKKEEKRA